MKIFWMIVSAVAMVVAGFFLLRRDLDKAFVVAALGIVAWFLNYRVQMRELIAKEDHQNDIEGDQEEDHEDLEDQEDS